MTQSTLISFAEDFFSESIDLVKKKNNDYSNTLVSKDGFGNFRATESFNIPVEIGFITRMTDKLSRISTFAHAGELKVKNESVIDTLRDLSNYAMLLAAWIEKDSYQVQIKQPKNQVDDNLPF